MTEQKAEPGNQAKHFPVPTRTEQEDLLIRLYFGSGSDPLREMPRPYEPCHAVKCAGPAALGHVQVTQRTRDPGALHLAGCGAPR